MSENNAIDNWDYLGLAIIEWPTAEGFIDIARINGWTQLHQLLSHWVSRPAYVLPVGWPANAPFNNQIISMQWVLGFSRAKTEDDRLRTVGSFLNLTAKNNIKRKLVPKIDDNGGRATMLINRGDPSDPMRTHNDSWIYFRSISTRLRSGVGYADGLDAALGNFNLRSFASGCGWRSGKNEYTFIFNDVTTYVEDRFDFVGDNNPTGWWNVTTGTGYGFAPRWSRETWAKYNNATFRNDRLRTGMGGDFFVGTPKNLSHYLIDISVIKSILNTWA